MTHEQIAGMLKDVEMAQTDPSISPSLYIRDLCCRVKALAAYVKQLRFLIELPIGNNCECTGCCHIRRLKELLK